MVRTFASVLRRLSGRRPRQRQARERQAGLPDRQGCRHYWEMQFQLCRADEQETLKCRTCGEMRLVEPTYGLPTCPPRTLTGQADDKAERGRRLAVTRRLEAGVFPPPELWPPDWPAEIERLAASIRRPSTPAAPRPGDDGPEPGR